MAQIFGDVWRNFLTVVILAVIFWMVWRKMNEGKIKDGIKGMIGKLT